MVSIATREVIPQRGRETWNEKKFSRILDGATRMALMRALKWAPTWYVSADIATFISYPDLIQRLAIKGIWGVSPDLSSGGSFWSSHSGHSHGSLENDWEVFLHFEFPCRTHTKLRLNLAGMLSRLESVGTMSSLHQMVHLKPKIALAQKWHPWSSPFRPFCLVKVQIFARQIQM